MAEGQGKVEKQAPESISFVANGDVKKKPNFGIVRSLGNAVFRSAAEPIVSLKSARLNRETGGKLLSFAIKVAALEIVRRHTQTRFPHVWAAIQSLPMLQIPPFSWLQHVVPFKYLFLGSQVFSKPAIFLSIATTFNDKLQELKPTEDNHFADVQPVQDDSAGTDTRAIIPLSITPNGTERGVSYQDVPEDVLDSLTLLKQEIQKAGIILPERIGDDELERFLIAANHNVKSCFLLLKKHIRWRETFYFMSPYELESWSSLVFWHGCDAKMRPTLVIRLGLACSILKTSERPRFVQAILSQVEYGVTHLLCEEDPRITVIVDCEGTPALGFPVHMLKSCCTRMQENYPTRLAASFVVNVPSVVRVIAQAVIQVLKPITRKKIHVLGDKHIDILAEHFGGCNDIPRFLLGSCSCSRCEKEEPNSRSIHSQLVGKEKIHDYSSSEDTDVDEDLEGDISTYSRYHSVLRAVIIAFLMLWVIVCLLAGLLDMDDEFNQT